MYYGPNLSANPYLYSRVMRQSYPTPYEALQQSLQTIRDTAAAAPNVEAFQQKLLAMAPTEEDRALLASIYEDERTHYQYLREIYKAFTGQEVPVTAPITALAMPTTYESGLRSAIYHKWDNAQKHGFILAAMPTGYFQNLIAKMAVDNTIHGEKLTYLIQKQRESR